MTPVKMHAVGEASDVEIGFADSEPSSHRIARCGRVVVQTQIGPDAEVTCSRCLDAIRSDPDRQPIERIRE